MSRKSLFIYDGECPFCNHFAKLLELKSGIPEIAIVNGRENISQIIDLYKKGFDLDKGAILLKGNDILHGAKAINWICSQIQDPSDELLKILSLTFSSNKRTEIIFHLLVSARRFFLAIKGVSRKLVS